MKISLIGKLLLLLLLAGVACLILPGTEETDPAPPGTGPPVAVPDEPGIIAYPRKVSPGDFFILQAGPFPGETEIALELELTGELSPPYRVGDYVYFIVGVSYITVPGEYGLALVVEPAGRAGSTYHLSLEIVPGEFVLSRFSMPAERTAGWTADRLAEDRGRVKKARLDTGPRPLWFQPFIQPVDGYISSEFGAIRIVNNDPPRRHAGIDLAADEGTLVSTTNRGVVRLTAFLLSGGNTVVIDHGMNLSSTYMHLHTIMVEEGESVERGQIIGTVGATGYATGPHLHWEVNLGFTPVNPIMLIKGALFYLPPALAGGMERAEAPE